MSASDVYADLIGKKFKWNACGPDEYDCWTLCREIYRRLGKRMPEFSYFIDGEKKQEKSAEEFERHKGSFTRLDLPVPFCIVAFNLIPRYVSHVGIVLENNYEFIHVLKSTFVVKERLDSIIWERKIAGYYEWIENCN